MVEFGADGYAHRKQVDIKQLYNQVPQTAWVSWSLSCSSRQWEPAPDRGFGPSGPRLSSLAEWGRSAAIVRGIWGQYVNMLHSLAVSNSPLTHNQYQTFRNPLENKVREVYFSKEVCSFVIIGDYVSAYIWIRIVVSWLYNISSMSRIKYLWLNLRTIVYPRGSLYDLLRWFECDVVDRFLQYLFWFFQKLFSTSGLIRLRSRAL